jgi:hypothetical protein
MDRNRIEIIAVVLGVCLVFSGLIAGFAGLVIEEEQSHVEKFADKTGTVLTQLTLISGDAALAYKTQDNQYINAESLINAYHGYTDTVTVYSVENGTVISESSAPISFNGAAGLLYSPPGKLIRGVAVSFSQ